MICIPAPGWTGELHSFEGTDADAGFTPARLVAASVATEAGDLVEIDLDQLRRVDPAALAPVRSPLPYHGQRHLPSYYFSISQNQTVFAESKLEAAWLLILDWSPAVKWVVAQPFKLVVADVDGAETTHTPDFIVCLENARPVIVNVRPEGLTDRPAFVRNVAVAAWIAECLGWQAAVLTEPPPGLVRNLRWLRNFARPMWGLEILLDKALGAVDEGGIDIGTCLRDLDHHPQAIPAVMHLLWHGDLITELYKPIGWDSLLIMAGALDD